MDRTFRTGSASRSTRCDRSHSRAAKPPLIPAIVGVLLWRLWRPRRDRLPRHGPLPLLDPEVTSTTRRDRHRLCRLARPQGQGFLGCARREEGRRPRLPARAIDFLKIGFPGLKIKRTQTQALCTTFLYLYAASIRNEPRRSQGISPRLRDVKRRMSVDAIAVEPDTDGD